MITEHNLKDILNTLGFKIRKGEVFECNYPNNAQICVDFNAKSIAYTPQDPRFKEGQYPSLEHPSTGFIIHRNTTTNFSSNENFVCLIAVHKLLEKGYAPEHIILEPTFKIGHGQQVYGDILLLDQEFNPLALIENKTYGAEFSKAWNATLKNGDQLFSYYAVHKTPYLCLLTFKDAHATDMRLISMQDNPKHLERLNRDCKQEDKKRGFADPSNTNAKSYFEVWSQTYSNAFTTKGLFEEDIQAYRIGKEKYGLQDLSVVSASQIAGIYHEFATILRHHSIGNYENSFYILVDLFLCKVIDEIKNPNDLQFTYKGVVADNPFAYCDRLLNLYEMGVQELFHKKVINVKKSAIGDLFKEAQRYEGKFKEKLDDIFDQQKYFNIKKFNFIEVENSEEFYLNFKVLVQVAGLIQDLHLSKSEHNQFLGDLFEGFLNRSIHQTEGRFFTPMPITNFIIHSLPPLPNNPKVLDFACGAGHFLTEIMARYPDTQVHGIEKNKDLSKVAKLACIFHNSNSQSQVIFQDALDFIAPRYAKNFELASFDCILSNPPYSVKGFLSTLEASALNPFSLKSSIDPKSYENNSSIECFFIERAWHFLKKGGIFALILPVSILQKGGIYEKTRSLLLERFRLLCIVELNSRTFGSTGTQTIILFAQKVQKYNTDLLNALVKANFEEKELVGDFKQTAFLKEYCAFMHYPLEDFKAFLSQRALSPALQAHAIFSEYHNDFKAKEPKVFKRKQPSEGLKKTWLTSAQDKRKQNTYLKSPEYQERLERWQNEQFYEDIYTLELDKMRAFALSKEEEVLILKSPPDKKSDNKSNKAQIVAFLGYDWSNRKGDEGIKYLSDQASAQDLDHEVLSNIASIKHIQTPLYNPSDPSDPSKLAHALKSFMRSMLENTPHPNLPRYINPNPDGYQLFSTPLSELIDFSKSVLDKAISLNPKQEAINPFEGGKWRLVKLGELILERAKSKIQVNQAKDNKEGAYPFYTSGLNIYRYDEALIEGENIYLSTGGNALVQFYEGESAYSTDTYVIASNDPTRLKTKYLFYVLNMQTDYINTHLFKGMGLKHLQKGDFKALKIPLPPLEVQEQIIAKCAQVEKRYEQVRMSVEQYKALILAVLEACGVCGAKNGGGGG
ncbi:N-6 DNA methylase [Helicobacter cynogastricus]|uniref:N-6 DNA methylase n=1 Tax=Helicobacter cynogastricus TaxID=329937 RepID=UPI000CF1BA42|nr:N-6 DNA methylase [Helicobacter cynogastricus]